ncbi:SET domain-containing protein [Mycena chlorophos]|uniref:SET domain-containing protein n=1 Tax=Mycena chlorophos TaxID=658473 RepID=A0A8H6SE77_MYCCL|nr:SET domain-containing protein [Mycena chlorophos]
MVAEMARREVNHRVTNGILARNEKTVDELSDRNLVLEQDLAEEAECRRHLMDHRDELEEQLEESKARAIEFEDAHQRVELELATSKRRVVELEAKVVELQDKLKQNYMHYQAKVIQYVMNLKENVEQRLQYQVAPDAHVRNMRQQQPVEPVDTETSETIKKPRTGPKAKSQIRPTSGSSRGDVAPCAVQESSSKKPVKVKIPPGFEAEFKRHAEERAKLYEWISMPPNAAESGEPVAECSFLLGTKQIFVDTPGFPQPLPPVPSQTQTSPAYRVAPIPGKGVGLVATRALKQGEIILTERPLLIIPAFVDCPVPESFTQEQKMQHVFDEWERFAQPSVERMTEERRRVFFELYNGDRESGSGPIMGVVQTNGIGLRDLQPGVGGKLGAYVAVCEMISRLNHSCSPNTQPIFSRTQFAYNLYAVRDVAEGEELTWQYTPTLQPQAERAEACAAYGFICDCPFCTADPERIAQSDARRQAIDGFDPIDAQREWAASSSSVLPDEWLVERCLAQLALLEKEGLQHCRWYCLAARVIMEAYFMLGNARSASEWAAVVRKRRWVENYLMAGDFRAPLVWPWLLLTLLQIPIASVNALPTDLPILPRSFTISNASGTVEVFDSNGNPVAQGAATDGSGSGFDLPALIWIGFSLLIGGFMAIAGIRGWRITTGAAIGLSSTVLTFAAIINSVDNTGLADIALTAIVLVIFAVGFAIGVFEFARLGAIAAIGLAGGTAFGIRVVLLRAGLLLPAAKLYDLNLLNWGIVGLFGAVGGLVLVRYQRYGLLFGCASIGTFLVGLGVDLVLERQSGMSLGLRFLFDRNDSHAAFFVANPYTAPLRTRIVLIASLALTPALAFMQHRLFKDPFTRRPVESDDALRIDFPTNDSYPEKKRATFLATLWDGARGQPDKVNRFSV